MRARVRPFELAIWLFASSLLGCSFGQNGPNGQGQGTSGAGGGEGSGGGAATDTEEAPSSCEAQTQDCATCAACASQDACAAPVAACANSGACAWIDDCIAGCGGDGECEEQCYLLSPEGAVEHDAATRCLYCQACPSFCAGVRPCP